MIRKSDVQWWVLEAKKHPESAPQIIEELAKRLTELDAENEQLRSEIMRMQRGATGSSSTEVSDLRRKVAELQTLIESEAATEPALVFLSSLMQSARLPFPKVQELIRAGRPVLDRKDLFELQHVLYVRPHDEVLLLTGQGHGQKLIPAGIPMLAEGGSWPETEEAQGPAEERLSAAVALAKPPRFWSIVTRRGFVRHIIHLALDRALAQGEPILASPLHNDRPVDLVSGDRGDLLLVTRWGKWTRFPQRAIPGEGVEAVKLEPDDHVVAAVPLATDTDLLVVTASGFVARRDTAQMEARTTPGGTGKPLIQAYDVVGAYPFESGAQLLYLTYSGRMTLVPVKNIPPLRKASKGTQVQDFGSDSVAAVALIPHDA